MCSKWLCVNQDLAYKRIIKCRNVRELKRIEKYLLKFRCKWENKITEAHPLCEVCRNRNMKLEKILER